MVLCQQDEECYGRCYYLLQGHGTARIINLTTQVNTLTGDSQSTEHQCILAFGGTRGYICPDDASFEPDTDFSIYDREILRTEAALQEMEHAIQALQKEHDETENTEETLPVTRVLLLHYPPFNENNAPSGFTDLMERYHVDICIFGHLHDQNSFKRIPSTFGTTKLELVSADYAEFKIQKIL